jgi:regulatory protein
MQLSLSFPSQPSPVNNRAMAGKDRTDADKLDAAKKLRNKALRLLTTREHSREELLRKLAQAKARRARQDAQSPAPEKDEVERVIDELAAQGWQSDERYAEAIVRRLTGQASRRYIEEKLASAGIKKDAAKQALEAMEQDEIEVATALWQRRFGEAPLDDKARQKQIRFLLSRGFHLGDAFKIVPRAQVATPAEGSQRTTASASAGKTGSGWGARDRGMGRRTPLADLGSAFDADSSDSRADGRDAGQDSSTAPVVELQYSRTSRGRPAADAAAGEPADDTGGSGERTGKAPLRRSSFQRKVQRARPWGARNDADTSDT